MLARRCRLSLVTRLQLTGVTFPNAIVASATPSPFVSHASVAAVVTVFPGLCSGIPVSVWNPWHMIVTSFGKNPHPTSSTAPRTARLSIRSSSASSQTSPVPLSGTCGFAGGAHPTPKKHTRPRFRSRCLATRAQHRVVSFKPQIEVRSRECYFASRPGTRLSPFVEQLEDRRLRPFSYAAVASDVRRLPFVSGNTPNGFASAAAAAFDRLISHNPGGFNGSSPPIE